MRLADAVSSSLLHRAVALDLPRRLSTPLPPATGSGWANATLRDAMRRPVLLAVVVVHGVLALVALVDAQERIGAAPLAATHLGVVGLALLTWRRGLSPVLAVVAADAAYLLDWAATSSLATPLVFTACWARNLSVAVPTFVVGARTGLAMQLTSSLGIPVAMLLLRPDLPASFAGAVAVTGLSITVVTRVGVSFLGDLAVTVDEGDARAERRERDLARQQAASSAAAEDARVLHDTVINTMAAIASGGAALRDVEAVRRRCHQDVAVLESLRSGDREDAAAAASLRELPAVPGIVVRHEWLDDPRAAPLLESLDPARRAAIVRSCAELVQNAGKHSGADQVTVRVTSDERQVVVEVGDDGAGFDLEAAAAVGRGLVRSVMERCEAAGVAVAVDTAPGAGTRVRMTTTLEGAQHEGDDLWERETRTTLDGVVRRAGLLFTVGLALVGFVLAFSNHHGEPNTEYVMAALDLAAVAAVRVLGDRGATARRLLLVLLSLTAAVSFEMTALAVDLGRDLPVLWQAIGPTGPLVLLLGLVHTPRAARLAAAPYLLVTAATALWVAPDSGKAAGVVLVAGGIGLGLVAAWSSFMGTLAQLGRGASLAQRRAASARTELEVRAAADRSRERWRAAGLDDALSLVRRVAEGDLDPRDPHVRESCAAEESYLRQLTLLDTRLVRLGTWLVECLALARARGVDLSLRTGGEDVADDVARRWGNGLLGVVLATPAGGPVVASIFPDTRGTRLMVLAPTPSLDGVQLDPLHGRGALRTYGDRVLWETLVPHAGAGDLLTRGRATA